MRQITFLKKWNGKHRENVLAPMSLTGIVVPRIRLLNRNQDSSFKLACFSGAEYDIITDSEWQEVLQRYRWEEVKIVGLLNLADLTLIPQKVFPKGPRGETENTIDLVAWKARDLAEKVVKNIDSLTVVPAIT